MSHKFNHSVLASKAICISFLREFGVAKDWTRVTIGEMRRMLASYADERLFDAAKRIVERDGDTFVREEFETSIDDDDTTVEVETIDVDQGDTRTVETVELEREVAKPKAKAKQAEQAPQPQAQAQAPDVGAVAAMLTQLLAAGRQSVNTEQVEEIAKRVADRATAALSADLLHAMGVLVDEAVKGIAPRQIVVKTERSEVKIDGVQHFNFEKLLRACEAKSPDGHRLNVWVYGPPGTGKTTAARNVSKALDLPFYCTGALLTKYDITGFIAAQGELIRSAFREAWEHGGIFLFDEIDGSDPRALVAFNSALANGVMAFPDGMVERHPDCVIIAAANTSGLGATAEYSGRMKMDMASTDRFIMLDWPIDEQVELALASNKAWVKAVQKVRANVKERGVKNVAITPRATIYGCALLETGLSIDDVKAMVLRKAMSPEQWALVAA